MKKQIIEFFKNNTNLFDKCAKELDAINGILDYSRRYPMSEIGWHYSNTKDLLQDVWYGSDCEGDKFCPMREYFYYDDSFILISTDYEDYSAFLGEDFIEELSECQGEIETIVNNPDLKEMFNALRKECRK